MNNLPISIFDRIIGRPRPLWVTLIVSILLILAPIVAAFLDGKLSSVVANGGLRSLLVLPAILIYILLIAPPLGRLNDGVVFGLRQIIPIKDMEFASLVDRYYHTTLINELLAFAFGAAFGLWNGSLSDLGPGFSWLKFYWYLFQCLVFGILGWTSYVSISSTRLPAALLRQPLRINIFDQHPFEAIGRQSLVLALVFIGGIALSLFFSFQPESLHLLAFWSVYLPLLLIPVAIFFLNMRPTHQVLAAEKKRLLETTQFRIQQAFKTYFQRIDEDEDISDLPAHINTLFAYDQLLKETRTWPYNTTMLRTLFFSVFIPFAMVLLRLVLELLI